jgi:hypothetical protein
MEVGKIRVTLLWPVRSTLIVWHQMIALAPSAGTKPPETARAKSDNI